MHTTQRILFLAAALAGLSACATALEPGTEKIKVVTTQQIEHSCVSLGMISTEQKLGTNRPANAMNKAMNEIARRGGNGVHVIANNYDWAEGATVTVQALRCEL
ncbi:MAG TPA: hypothetical protein VFW00_10400 [Rhodocyclaceae bacterium]|nr:hypothetical protein [Rhodocyclaceae bacterium]